MHMTAVYSLVLRLHVPPGEKWSSEQSRISWAYSPKVVVTNEIARSIICSTSFTTVKIFISTQVSVHFLSGFGVKCFECC